MAYNPDVHMETQLKKYKLLIDPEFLSKNETPKPTVELARKLDELAKLEYTAVVKPKLKITTYPVTDTWTQSNDVAFLCYLGSNSLPKFTAVQFNLGKKKAFDYLKMCFALLKDFAIPAKHDASHKVDIIEPVLHRPEVLRYYYKYPNFMQMMHEYKPERNFWPTRVVDNLTVDRDTSGPRYKMINHYYNLGDIRYGFYESWLDKEDVRMYLETDMTAVFYGGKVYDRFSNELVVWPRDLSHLHLAVSAIRRSTSPLCVWMRPKIRKNSRGQFYRLTRELYFEFLSELVVPVPTMWQTTVETAVAFERPDKPKFVAASTDLMASDEIADLEAMLMEQDDDDLD